MKDFRGKQVLITGAGSGIGRETALAFAEAEACLWVVDIQLANAEETVQQIMSRGGRARALQCDVADMASVQRMADAVHAEIPALDILMNNAGIGSAGRFLDTELETWRKVMDVNLMGVVHGCHAFLGKMVERGQGGHVINTASAAAFVAAPDMPIYAASKFAVQGFTEALRGDMATHDIGVTAICPGIINTAIVANSIMEGKIGAAETHDKVMKFYEKRNYTPAQVARVILSAVRRNVGVQPVSPEAWGMYYAKRFTPGLLQVLSRKELPFLK
ncbi:MAG: SDR family NAD(P)-dependent oxidoreductase [Alcanivorax sp.]|nr:SDR family NAD(P)-dependent oxidoreductase [Alcanivorax sp.]